LSFQIFCRDLPHERLTIIYCYTGYKNNIDHVKVLRFPMCLIKTVFQMLQSVIKLINPSDKMHGQQKLNLNFINLQNAGPKFALSYR